VLTATLERTFDFAQEVRFFTYELSERYEEINLLYSISETLGSILALPDAARLILQEVCDVLGARRGSLWVHRAGSECLERIASVGEGGLKGPLSLDDPTAVTSQVFREGRALLALRKAPGYTPPKDVATADIDSFLSVPIRYTPPEGEARTVGVLNLFGRRHGGRFTASDQKLLSAIASQVGAALENKRLILENMVQERMAHEMELAHNLQMTLLPSAQNFDAAEVAARVQPAEQVGGDFYHLFKLPSERIGVMIGDVSSHGFPAALIMALSMSASAIYATEGLDPGGVLRRVDDALADELANTEMYLSLFYGVIDPAAGTLTYSNAGHPHAFVMSQNGDFQRLTATDPPVGFAGPEAYGQCEVPWQTGQDLLLLFTDGLSDTLASVDRGSGEDAVLAAAQEMSKSSPQELVDSLFRLAAEATPNIPSDDRTAVALRA
jgi:sigma-B regulation protein RsbU (phosphoserine phosphatase)